MKRRNFIKNSGFTVGSSILLANLCSIEGAFASSTSDLCLSRCELDMDKIKSIAFSELIFRKDANGNLILSPSGLPILDSFKADATFTITGRKCSDITEDYYNCSFPFFVQAVVNGVVVTHVSSSPDDASVQFDACPDGDQTLTISVIFNDTDLPVPPPPNTFALFLVVDSANKLCMGKQYL